MKQRLLLLMVMLLPMMAMTNVFEIDGVYYNLNTSAKIKQNNNSNNLLN